MSASAAPPAMAVAPVGPSDARARRAMARADLLSAERELEASASNCTAACRALGSMDRAAGEVCSLTMPGDDTRTCEDAKARLLASRERVRSACGSCPNGPSVEANAPVPSR